ncbi:MAG: transposase [Nitrospinae bacterium]|nr:transposase [Nitrospinota bacterium]
MIITDIEYHFVLLLTIADLFEEKMKSDLAIIIPDVLLEFKGGVKRLQITPDQVYVHCSVGPDASPKQIAETLMHETSERLVRVNPSLKTFNTVFRSNYFIKTGAKPSKTQIRDFVSLSITGI